MSSYPHSNREVNVPESSQSHPNVTRVLASRSQRHHKYADSRNSQCSCNCATFLAFQHELQHLQSADLDLVLDGGHAMYALIQNQLIADGRQVAAHLNTEELPEIVFGYRQHHIMTECESMFGVFTAVGEGDYVNLADRLQCLSSGVNYALLIMASVCIAVFRDQQGRYGFFDPHSRRHDGLPHGPGGTGTAVMFIFTHLSDLITKIVTSFRMLGASPEAPYELTPVLFHTVDALPVDENVEIEMEMSLPSCSVTESTPCAVSTSEANEFMHVSSREGAVECTTSETPKT